MRREAMNRDAPKISICLPNLNTRPFLAERMETILTQTLTDWELIVCDSHSDDGAWEFFQKFEGDPRIHLHQVPREGIYAGWNQCLRRARGEYVYIATSDDTAVPGLLETLAGILDVEPEIHVAACDYDRIDERGRRIAGPIEEPRRMFGEWADRPCVRSGTSEFLLNICMGPVWGPAHSILFRRRLLEATGLFRTDVGYVADSEWALRASLATNVAYLPERLVSWRVHDRQATPRNWTLDARKALLEGARRVIRETDTNLPDEWKRVRDWRERLVRPRLHAYLDLFRLQRSVARWAPNAFAKGLCAALRREPAWALGRTLRGFPKGSEADCDMVSAARELLDIFQPPWPPKPARFPAAAACPT